MKNIEAMREKLKQLYYDAMMCSNIYTKEEAIELFIKKDFSDDDFLFIQKSESKARSKTDVSFDFCDQKNSIEYSEDTMEEILLCDDDDYFFINTSYEDSYKNTSKLLYTQIKKEFNIKELPMLVQLLKDDCINFNKNYKNNVKHSFEYIESILSDDNIYSRFVSDEDFGEEMVLIYVYNFEEKDKERMINLSHEIMETPEIVTLNDMIRNTFLRLYNRSIQVGVMPNDVVVIIREYLKGNLTIDDFKELYKNIGFDNINFNIISNTDYIKKIMISDYCRFKQMQIEYQLIEDADIDQLCFIESHSMKTIIENFNMNNYDFATNIITDFIIFNNDFSLAEKRNYNNNKKLLKKINPCYQLDFIDFNAKNPKTNN